MELFFVGLVAIIVGFLVGVMVGMKKIAQMAMREIKVLKSTQAIDRANYLFTLRRELANLLIWRDPQRYLKLFQELSSEFKSFESWRLEEINKRLAELCEKYPFYEDFDIINSTEYVLYSDKWLNYEELEARYRDIASFVALSVVGNTSWKDEGWRWRLVFDDGDGHLSEYVQSIEDTKLIARMDQVMEDPKIYELTLPLDNDSYSVRYLYDHAETHYGIHFKLTNEFAIYTSFDFDDGHTTNGHYRSDSTFEKQEILFANRELLEELKRPL
jgi:hypothetical protein